MKTCTEVDALVTAYVDGEIGAPGCAEIEAHLAVCPRCRAAAAAERTARELVCSHRPSLIKRASGALRNRCTGASLLATPLTDRPALDRDRLGMPLAIAAGVLLFIGALSAALFVFSSDAGLVAQLVDDHDRCFTGADAAAAAPIDPRTARARLRAVSGWDLAIPPSDQTRGLTLVDVRRCAYADGPVAHVLYWRQGRPLSLYIVPNVTREREAVEVAGHEARVWPAGGQTFALIGDERPDQLDDLADYVRAWGE